MRLSFISKRKMSDFFSEGDQTNQSGRVTFPNSMKSGASSPDSELSGEIFLLFKSRNVFMLYFF